MRNSIALVALLCSFGTAGASCSSSCSDSDVYCRSQFLSRSSGAASYRQHMVRADSTQTDREWAFDVFLDYAQSFDSENLGEYFSFQKGCNTFTVGPHSESTTNIRNTQLGLAPDFKSEVTFNPRIRNLVFEPSFYLSLDKWIQNTWFSLCLPITWTQWDLNCCEKICEQGATTLAAGTVAQEQVNVGARSALDALGGCATFGDKSEGLACCRVVCCSDSTWGIGDIPMMLGWKFINKDRGFVGLYALGVAPAGNEPEGKHIFEPRVGYHRWQFGGGIHSQVKVWTCSQGDTNLWAYGDVHATHLFSHDSCRCFDLCKNGCGSKYLLLKEFQSGIEEYNGKLVHVADIAKIKISSKFDYELEATFGLKAHRKGLTVNLGYNLWARSGESFDCCEARLCRCSDSFQEKRYGIKDELGVGSNSMQRNQVSPCATMCTLGAAESANEDTNLISRDNILDLLNYDRAAIPSALSHTLYLYGGYSFTKCSYPINVGLGGKVEFATNNKALNTWGLWGRAGISF